MARRQRQRRGQIVRSRPRRRIPGRRRAHYMSRRGFRQMQHRFVEWASPLSASNWDVDGVNLTVMDSNTTWQLACAASSVTTYGTFALNFQLSDLSDYTTFTGMFDQYKLLGVQLRITPLATVSQSDTGGGAASVGGVLHLINDYDDSTNPTTNLAGLNKMRHTENYRSYQLFSTKGGVITHYIRPRLAVATYAGGLFSSYGNQRSGWIDTVSPNVEHYGIKGLIEGWNQAASAGYIHMKVEAKYYLAFKQRK